MNLKKFQKEFKMTAFTRWFESAGVFCLVLSGCRNAATPSHFAIHNAEPNLDNSPTLYVANSTVGLVAPDGSTFSGAIVSNTRILTAVHCIHDFVEASQYTINFGSVVSNAVSLHGVGKVRRHPMSDLGTIDLEAPVPAGFLPVPVLPANSLKAGQNVVAAGFGSTGPNSEGVYEGANTVLRWGWLTFEAWHAEVSLASPGGPNKIYRSVLSFVPGENGSNICLGDSGGPLYAQVDGSWGLTGVNSGVDGDCNSSALASDPRANSSWIIAP